MAETKKNKKAGGTGGGSGFMVSLVLVLLIGAGVGFCYGILAQGKTARPHAAARGVSPSNHAVGANQGQGGAGDKADKNHVDSTMTKLVPIDPILVNLAGSKHRWIRLEGAITMKKPDDKGADMLVAEISQDFAGFLRSTSLAQLDSAAGLEFLREDLAEIVHLRSKGRAGRFILRSLVVE